MSRFTIRHALPLLVDGATALALVILLPDFALRLEQPSGWNALLLVLAYLFFSLGVYLIRKLAPWSGNEGWQPPAWIMNPKMRVALAVFFSLLMMTTVAYQIGYFESVLSVDASMLNEGDSSALLVYMPGALLGFSMLYILVLAFPVTATVRHEDIGFTILAFLGLLFISSLLLFTTAQAKAIIVTFNLEQSFVLYALSFLTLSLSFFPPRLLYQNKQPFSYGLLSFLILLLLSAWQVVA
jgi:hypothetical protein